MISRATTPRKAKGNSRSSTAAAAAPVASENSTPIRPASHASTRSASGPPRSGIRPVQLGIAVSMNPGTVAAAKPKVISWACQTDGGNTVRNWVAPPYCASHKAIPTQAHTADSRKNGRKPADKSASPASALYRGIAAMTYLGVLERAVLRSCRFCVVAGLTDVNPEIAAQRAHWVRKLPVRRLG